METRMPKLTTQRKQLLTHMMKEAIFEATTIVLSEHGAKGLTMDRVAAAAKLAKGSLYNYFRSKEDLLRFVYDRIIEPIAQHVEQIATGDLPALAKLERMLCTLFEQTAQHRGVLGVLLRDDLGRDVCETSLQSARQNARQYFVTIFDQGMREGVFRPFDALSGAEIFFAALDKIFERHLLAGQSPPVGEVVQQIMGLLLYGVAAPGYKHIVSGATFDRPHSVN
jgi:AcrR family transcriptional regulator